MTPMLGGLCTKMWHLLLLILLLSSPASAMSDGRLDMLVENGGLLAVVSIFIGYLIKARAIHRSERADTAKMHSEERAAEAKERIATQENFKDFLIGYSGKWSDTQTQIAESLTLLSREISTMSAKNSTEHSEILDWTRTQKYKSRP